MLYKNMRLRRIVLPLMKRLSFDFTVGHHWLPGARVRLGLFEHKDYWYHGRERERETMEAFARLIPRGGTVIEVGGHIGYISMYLASLAGPRGRVIVFEPGPNNHKYLKRNIAGLDNVEWVDRAVSDRSGPVTFYCDNLTGQNNSLVSDFKVPEINAARTGIALERSEVTVEATTLDAFCAERGLMPEFIKVDVEGAEWRVVRGMKSVLRTARPRLMIEKDDPRDKELERELGAVGYVILPPALLQGCGGRMHFRNKFYLHVDDPLLAEMECR